MGRLQGKTALITGGARGLGLAFAKRYVEEGAKVALADINVEEAKRAAGEIGPEMAMAVPLNVTSQESIDKAVQSVIDQFGHIDILVNCAAIFDMAPLEEISRQSYEQVFSANVAGTLFTIQAVAKHMISYGKGGKIINMASQAGRQGDPLVTVYCASKAAVISITQSCGMALAKYGINVNGIAPGYCDTEMWRKVDAMSAKYEQIEVGEKTRRVAKALPIGRISVPEDLAGMALFLASDDANYVVAQTYNVDGGSRMN